VPWIVLSSFLLTENVAYPTFCWALLALDARRGTEAWRPTCSRSARSASPCSRARSSSSSSAFLVVRSSSRRCSTHAARAPAELWRTRRPFVVLYGALLLVVLGAIAIGKGSQLLGSYSVTAEHVRLDFGLVQLGFEHVASLALGLAILPFIVGVGWLVDRCGRRTPGASARSPSSAARARARDAPGRVVQPALRAGLVKDRYLFYVVPSRARRARRCGCVRAQWPRWWALVVPTAAAASGSRRRRFACTRSSTSTRRSRS
jgi:hypothetical protein